MIAIGSGSAWTEGSAAAHHRQQCRLEVVPESETLLGKLEQRTWRRGMTSMTWRSIDTVIAIVMLPLRVAFWAVVVILRAVLGGGR